MKLLLETEFLFSIVFDSPFQKSAFFGVFSKSLWPLEIWYFGAAASSLEGARAGHWWWAQCPSVPSTIDCFLSEQHLFTPHWLHSAFYSCPLTRPNIHHQCHNINMCRISENTPLHILLAVHVLEVLKVELDPISEFWTLEIQEKRHICSKICLR